MLILIFGLNRDAISCEKDGNIAQRTKLVLHPLISELLCVLFILRFPQMTSMLCQGAEWSPMCGPTTLRVDLNRVLEKLASPIIRHTLSVEARDHI